MNRPEYQSRSSLLGGFFVRAQMLGVLVPVPRATRAIITIPVPATVAIIPAAVTAIPAAVFASPTAIVGTRRTRRLRALRCWRSAEAEFQPEPWAGSVPATGASESAQIVGRDPAVRTALFNVAPADTAARDFDALASAEAIDHAVATARARTNIDIGGCAGRRRESDTG